MAKSKNKTPFYFLRRADGTPSLSVTLVLVSFYVTTGVYILSAFDSILHWQIKPFDPAAVGAYMVPILTLYGARRHTEAKMPAQQSQNTAVDEEDQSE